MHLQKEYISKERFLKQIMKTKRQKQDEFVYIKIKIPSQQ